MARSASPRALAVLACAVALAGCATTMQEAARLQLNDARIRVSQQRTRVTSAGAAVRVQQIALVRARHGAAFVVKVRNLTSRAVSDLPISVGVRTRARRAIYLNARPTGQEYSYFDAHLPVIAAGGALTWVYTTRSKLPGRARPFALVGAAVSVPVHIASPVPAVSADIAPAGSGRGLAIAVRNASGIPQYQLQVYAFARSAGRIVAAGKATIVYLGGQDSRTLHLGLLGSPGGAHVQLEALPTIFQ